MKMQGKPGVVIWNLVAIPLLMFCLLASNADLLQEIVTLLTNSNFFNLDIKDANILNTNAASIASFGSIPCLLISGVVYDVVGRRKTIIGLLIIGAICTYLLPVSGNPPRDLFFIVLRVGLQISMVCIMGNTLINDYVVTENRGRGSAIQNAGMTLGNIFSVSVMFSITKNEHNLYMMFGLLGTLQVIWAVMMFFVVAEPIGMYNEKEAKRAARKSFCGKVWSLMKLVFKACKKDKALLIGIIASNIARNQTMLMQVTYPQWLQSFVVSGVL
jgi:MFS family permease